MMSNGNYEQTISPVQHECHDKTYAWSCIEYGWDIGTLHLKINEGDPYEDGYANEISVAFCPFCGYRPERLSEKTSKEGAIV